MSNAKRPFLEFIFLAAPFLSRCVRPWLKYLLALVWQVYPR